MAGKPAIRLWQRDTDVLREVSRWLLLTSQIWRLCGFSSWKKAAERLHRLFRAGEVKRMPSYLPARQGKPEFAYFLGVRPHPRTLPHTVAIGEARVQFAEWQRTAPEYTLDFYYTNEAELTASVIPDATVIIRKDAKAALHFLEVDLGTEHVFSPRGHYSLASKLACYATYFDGGVASADFSWAGEFQGFRVLCLVPPGRVGQLAKLVRQEGHDFVWVADIEQFKLHGPGKPIFQTHDGLLVDVLGRRGSDGGFSPGNDRAATPQDVSR